VNEVGNVDEITGQADREQERVEVPAALPHKWLTLAIFIETRILTDEHNLGGSRSDARNGSCATIAEVTVTALADEVPREGESGRVGENDRGAVTGTGIHDLSDSFLRLDHLEQSEPAPAIHVEETVVAGDGTVPQRARIVKRTGDSRDNNVNRMLIRIVSSETSGSIGSVVFALGTGHVAVT
jgi:hypothetical protein